MALTPQEEAELAQLEAEFGTVSQPINARKAAPSRKPGDLQNVPTSILSPEEEAELAQLEAEFAARPVQTESTDQNIISQIGETIDSYTGAPVRQAYGTFQDTGDIRKAGSAFLDQFGADPDLAPTGKEIAIKAGFSPENAIIPRNPMAVADEARAFNKPIEEVPKTAEVFSPAGMVGFGADMALDLTNLLPFAGIIAKKATQGTGAALKGTAKATDAVLGTPLIKAADTAADTVKATTEATKNAKIQLSKLFKPDVAPDFDELKSIMKANNIPDSYVPEAIEFGEDSIISRAARNNAEGPLGGDTLQKFSKFQQDVSNAAENKIIKLGGAEKIPGKQEAGRILREGYDQGVDEFFKKMDFTYDSIIQMNPGIQLTPESVAKINEKMAGIEKKAKGLVKRGITATDRSQGKELLNAVAAYRNAGASLKQQKEAMNMIGRAAFKSVKSGAELPSDVRSLREMYFSLQKGFTESTRAQLGDDIADALIENNKQMSQHFTERGQISKVIEGAKADEEVFESLVARGNSKQLDSLKRILTMGGDESKWNAMRATYLDGLMNRNADDVINFESTRKKLNLKKDQLKNIFTADELKEIDDVLKLGDRSGKAVLSSSGTGASNMFKDLVGTIQAKVGGDVYMDQLKRGARDRYMAKIPYRSPEDAAKAAESIAPKKSGVQLLKEKSPINKKQAAQGARLNSIQDRNEKLDKIRKIRGY